MDKDKTIKKLEHMAEEIERSGREHTGPGPNDRYLRLLQEYHDLVDGLLDRGLLTEPLAQPCLDDLMMSDKYWNFIDAYWDANPPEFSELLQNHQVRDVGRVKITRAENPKFEGRVLENFAGRLPDEISFSQSPTMYDSARHWFRENDECLMFFRYIPKRMLVFGRVPIRVFDGRECALFFSSKIIPGISARPVQFEESQVTAYPLDELIAYIKNNIGRHQPH